MIKYVFYFLMLIFSIIALIWVIKLNQNLEQEKAAHLCKEYTIKSNIFGYNTIKVDYPQL